MGALAFALAATGAGMAGGDATSASSSGGAEAIGSPASAAKKPKKKPTRLWYKVKIKHEGRWTHTLHAPEGVRCARIVPAPKYAEEARCAYLKSTTVRVGWTARTVGAVLLRKIIVTLPQDDPNKPPLAAVGIAIRSGELKGSLTRNERRIEENFGGCVYGGKEDLVGTAPVSGDFGIRFGADGYGFEPQLRTTEPIQVRYTQPKVVCQYMTLLGAFKGQQKGPGEPVVYEGDSGKVEHAPFDDVGRLLPPALVGAKVLKEPAFGLVAKKFGANAFTHETRYETELSHKTRGADFFGYPMLSEVNTRSLKWTFTFTRCPGTKPC